MLRLTLLVFVAVGIDQLHGQQCSLQLIPQVPVIQVARGNNVTILCDASCYGRHAANKLSWYDRHNQSIGMSGRVFSVQYNRGMFTRLILLNTDFSETGRYTCAGRAGVDVVQRSIDIIVTESDFEVVEYVDDGPRRGDVRVDEPVLPRRRPVRDVRKKRDTSDSTPMSSEDSSSSISTQPSTDSSSSISTQPSTDSSSSISTQPNADSSSSISTQPSTDSSSSISTQGDEGSGLLTTEAADEAAGEETGQGQSTNESTTFPTSSSPGNAEDQSTNHTPSAAVESPSGKAASSSSTSSPGTDKTTTTGSTRLTSSSGPTKKDSAGSPVGTDKTNAKNSPTTTPPTESSTTNGTVNNGYKGTYKSDKTAFGKYGVLAFALALSAAILLLYTLILLNVIIPRCCKNKQSVSFRETPDSNHKQNGPSSIDVVAMKPLAIEPRPNSPDDGFTTVDLDDKADPKPNSNTQGEKEPDIPVSPSSDPGSPSKFVSTFLIGRKPSESSPLGVYLHEGKPVEAEQVISETGDSQGPSDPKPEQNATEETKTEDGKKDLGGLGGQSVKEDVDTSTEVDTSTDTRDTSASSSDLGDLPSAGLKT